MWIKVMSTLRWSEAAFVIYHLIYWRCKAGPVAGEQPRTASVSEPSRCVCIHRPAHTCRHKLPTMLVEVRDQLSNGFLNHLPLSIWGRVFPWTWTLPTHFSRLSEQQTPGPLLSLNAEIFFFHVSSGVPTHFFMLWASLYWQPSPQPQQQGPPLESIGCTGLCKALLSTLSLALTRRLPISIDAIDAESQVLRKERVCERGGWDLSRFPMASDSSYCHYMD